MAQQFRSSEDPSLSSARLSPSTSSSIERESSELPPSTSLSLSIEEQVKKITESYLTAKNLNPSGTQKLIDDLAKELTKKNDDDIKEIERKIASAETEIQNSKQRVTETLGIFVALFTFVSVSFQIFDKVNNLTQIVSLELVLLGSLTIFILLLHLLMQPRKKRSEFGEAFLKYPIKKQLAIALKAVLVEKPLMLVLNNGTATFLLLLSFILVISGALGVFRENKQEEASGDRADESRAHIENNNSFNLINEASSSAIKK